MQRITALHILSTMLLWCAAGISQSTESSAKILPIDLFRNYLIVVRGSIGPLQNRHFIIDTGAYPTVISPQIAKKLHLSGHKEQVRVLGRNMDSDVVYVPLLQLGPLQSKNLRVVVKDLGVFDRHLGLEVDAMVGLDVLRQSNFRIDYRERKLIFGPTGSLPFATPIRWDANDANKACIDVEVNGEARSLLLDSGAADITLFQRKFAELAREPSQGWASANLGGAFHLRQIRLRNLGAAGSKLGSREVFLSDTDNMSPFAFEGLLAIGAERFRQVEFDFEHQTFSWEPVKWRAPDSSVAQAALTQPNPSALASPEDMKSKTSNECGNGSPSDSSSYCDSVGNFSRQEP